ncbi:MAG: diaminopimelate epimerase [Desulfobacteraceae bacterium]|nr:diaminopimelate epimerase [Desulfobacteraceae bacterium]
MSNRFPRLAFPLPFTKMSGTGNDFIVIDHRRPRLAEDEMPDFARLVCRHKLSAGADGLILIENDEECDFRWRFFNADGSQAEMCGNGARCAARFAHRAGIAGELMRFRTIAGVIAAQMVGQGVKIRLTPPAGLSLGRALDLGSATVTAHSVNTGVPHVVCLVDEIAQAPVAEWGRIIRHHQAYQPAGTNVNFVQITPDRLLIRTYERGVEGETLACGTGSVAAAIVTRALGRASSPVRVATASGEELMVHLKDEEVFLEGPARFIYDGMLQAEALI